MKSESLCQLCCPAVAFLLCLASTTNAGPLSKLSPMEPRISVVTLGVADLNRSFKFYKDGLGFPTKMTPDGGIVLFATTGTRMFLYPYTKLAVDVGIEAPRPADAGR